MIPRRSQFRRWSYPSKLGFVLFSLGVAISVVLWLFPDGGKRIVQRVISGLQETIPVPGDTAIVRI